MSHLDIESPKFEGKSHLWIQWKGTDVCCDVHCVKCDNSFHYDGSFFYFFQCPVCNQIYECGSHIEVYPIDQAPNSGSVTLLNADS